MGTTFHLHIPDGQAVESDGNDCSWMYRLNAYLDGRCRELGVPMLSSFFDHTDLEASKGEEDPEAAPGVDDMQWFPAADGLLTLAALADSLDGVERFPGIPDGRGSELLDELNGCVEALEPAAKKGLQFHLAVLV